VTVTLYTFKHKQYFSVLINLLTVVGFKQRGSNTAHIYTKTLFLFVGTFVNCIWDDTLRQYHSILLHTNYMFLFLILLLIAVGLRTWLSNTVHIYTQPACLYVDTFLNCSWFETKWQ